MHTVVPASCIALVVRGVADKDVLVPVRVLVGIDLAAVAPGTIVVVAAADYVALVVLGAAAQNVVPVTACAFAAAVSALPNICSVYIREILTF